MSEKRGKRSTFDVMSEYMDEFEAWADGLMESAFPESPSWNIDACCLNALCNISITPREVIITTDLPNIDTETVKVGATDENFEITAQMKKKVRFADLGIYYRQGEFSSLRCQARIPVSIDSSKMTISLKGRLWEVRFPRKKSHQ
jgi:HSP20 family molecular chaperone IbpA